MWSEVSRVVLAGQDTDMWVPSDYVVNKGNMNKENPFAQSENRKVQKSKLL